MQTQPDYSDYLLGPPTAERRATLRKERNRTLADPLEEGVVLAWDGPSLHPGSLPPTDYPRAQPPQPTPHTLRRILSSLPEETSPARGGTGWQLRLVEGVQTGEDKWSQVWRCEVVDVRGQELAGSVVLKLYQQSLFPIPGRFDRSEPRSDRFVWHPARHAVERESQAYSLLKTYQGRYIPLCYGFYPFVVPSGETVIGIVLEDLVDATLALPAALKCEIRGSRLTLDKLDDWICAALELQHRFHQHGLLRTCEPSGLLHFRNVGRHGLVFVGFSSVSSRDHLDALEEHRLASLTPEQRAQSSASLTWEERDDRVLLGMIRAELEDDETDLFKAWKKLEKERRRLPWLYLR